jgi:branched-subunit amino acid aminotransferase/4-amino-4-deoxychorismate lyase
MTPARRPFPDGSGIFETMRTESGRVAEFGRHMRRALSASQALGIRMPDEESIRIAVQSVIKDNPYPIGRLRISIGNSGLVVTHDEYLESTEGGYLTFSPHTSKAKGEQFKTYPYDEHYEIVDEARAHGFDDAIIFNSANNVTETGLSNIAFLIDGLWVTPPITAGILPGIMRAIAVERCGVQVRNIHITEVPLAQEIVLLGSLKIAQPVVQVGEMRLANGAEATALAAQIREKVEYFSVG